MFETTGRGRYPKNTILYYGKIEKRGPHFLTLRDVYYIQSQVNQETREVMGNILIKRGKEWHAPDLIVLNTDHILLIEPVSPGSKVAELIAESNGK